MAVTLPWPAPIQQSSATVGKEGAHGGTRGSPVKLSGASVQEHFADAIERPYTP